MNIPEVSDGNAHTLKIVCANKKPEVFADGNTTAALSVNADLLTLLQLENGEAFVSVNSFSGVAHEKQTLNNWQFKAY